MNDFKLYGYDKIALIEKPSINRNNNILYIIKEAWGQPEISVNLTNIAYNLYIKQGVRKFFVEGIFEPLTSQQIRERGRHLSGFDTLLKTGKLKPVEYIALTNNWDFEVLPVDNNELYDENFGALMAAMQNEKYVIKSLGFIYFIINQQLKSIPDEWRQIYCLVINNLKQASGDFNTFICTLVDFAKLKNIDLSDSEQLLIIRQMVEKENEIEKIPYRNELNEIIKELFAIFKNDDPDEDLLQLILTYQLSKENSFPQAILNMSFESVQAAYKRGQKALLAELEYGLYASRNQTENQFYIIHVIHDLCRCVNLNLEKYKNARQYFTYMFRIETLLQNSARLQKNVKYLEKKILKSFPESSNLWSMYNLENDLILISKLLKAQLEPDQLKYIERIRTGYTAAKIIQRLQKISPSTFALEELKENLHLWDTMMLRAIRFYDYAKLRREGMSKIIHTYFNKKNKEKAAIFLGGFHACELKRDLNRMNSCSSVVITPVMKQMAANNLYSEIMKGQR